MQLRNLKPDTDNCQFTRCTDLIKPLRTDPDNSVVKHCRPMEQVM